MRKFLLSALTAVALQMMVLGQASMSSPVVRTTVEQISFSTHFSGFSADESYRLGLGTPGAKLNGVKIELEKDGKPLSRELVSFEQGYAQSWFDLDRIQVEGFVFPAGQAPSGELVLKVTVPKQEAERVKRLFVIVARQFGPQRWYIEDGAELNESNW